MFDHLKNSLLTIAFPVECRVCGTEVTDTNDGVACSDCWSTTRIFSGDEMLCTKCGAFFGPRSAPVDVRCHQCDDHDYESASALGIYEKALAASILRLKNAPIIPNRLTELLYQATRRDLLSDIDLIVPTPLSKQRMIERGFNQAEVIARSVARVTGIPVDSHSLVRTTNTPMHRGGMDKRARELTVINAFKVLRPNIVKGSRVLLVDDVFTSGSTASNCAKALKKAGAERVKVLTLARAVKVN